MRFMISIIPVYTYIDTNICVHKYLELISSVDMPIKQYESQVSRLDYDDDVYLIEL
jgi:hypothetical protein